MSTQKYSIFTSYNNSYYQGKAIKPLLDTTEQKKMNFIIRGKNYLFFQQKHFLIQAQQAMFDAMITKATKIMVRNTHSRGKHLPTITLRRDFASLWQYEISS